jgi:hypothetical protein
VNLPRKRAAGKRRTTHPIRPPDEFVPEDTDELERAERAAAYDRCHRRKGCAAHVALECNDRNEHAHHRKLRAQGGATDDVNLLNVCHHCHTWIHANVAVAVFRGLLVPMGYDPADWPVRAP